MDGTKGTQKARTLRPARPAIGVLFALLLAIPPEPVALAAQASEPSGAPARAHYLTPESLLQTVRELSAPRYGGRLSGTPGNEAAAEWLARELATAGFKPLPGAEGLLLPYVQPVLRSRSSPQLRVELHNGAVVELVPGRDFDVLIRPGTSISGTVCAPAVRLTAETATPRWIARHRSCVVVVSAPVFEAIARNRETMGALFDAESGPKAVILVGPSSVRLMPRSLFLSARPTSSDGPVLAQMTHRAAERIGLDSMKGVTLRAGYRVERARVPTVAARLPGTTGRPLVISAHLDGPGSFGQEVIYPGAVDNGTGVAVTLDAARAIAGNARPDANFPQRSLWVLFFNGEEQGLYGSAAFAADYADMLEGAEVVNVDMVGHEDALAVEVSRLANATGLARSAADALRAEGIQARVSEGGGGDHASFAPETGFAGARAVTLVQAPYRRMHTIGDTPAEISPELLSRLAQAVERLLVRRLRGE